MGEPQPTSLPAEDLAELFKEHSAGLAGAARGILGARADVQEVLQEAFLRAWQGLSAGNRPNDPVAWVFVLTMNLARDLRRKDERRGRAFTNLDEVDRMSANRLEPAMELEGREALGAAREAILRLEEDVKQVFLLRVSGELSFEAIAEALGIPVGTAKTRMRTALRRLQKHLAAFAPDATEDLRARGEAR